MENQSQDQKQPNIPVDELIRKIVHEELELVQAASAAEVIKEMNTVIDEAVSKKVKEHLKEIAEYILSKTKED